LRVAFILQLNRVANRPNKTSLGGNPSQTFERRIMAKPKTIKLKAAERKEADELQRNITIARYGIETSQKIHYEAQEKLWERLRGLYPELADKNAVYSKGTIVIRERGDKPCG